MIAEEPHFTMYSGLSLSCIKPLLCRLTNVCAATALLCSLPVASRAVDIDAIIGFGQSVPSRAVYRPETCTPVTVYLTGAGVKGECQLQVLVRNADQVATYSRRITLPEGQIKEARTEGFVFRLNPLDYSMGRMSSTSEVTIQLLNDGRQIAHKTVALPLATSSDSYNVLALTRSGSGLNFLTRKKMGLFHRHSDSEETSNSRPSASPQQSNNGVNPNASLTLAYTRPESLPVNEQGYDMVDAIALADMPVDGLTEAQTSALKGWVRSGGLLILSGGGDMARLKSQFWQEMLPIAQTGSGTANDLPELSSRYHWPIKSAVPFQILKGSLKPGARVLLGSAANPLVIAAPYGAGTVVLTTFDYQDPTVRSWSGGPLLWRDLLKCGNDMVQARNTLRSGTRNGSAAMLVADALAGRRATSTPAFYTIAIFLAAYIILLVPVSYFILKRIDRRELAWYTAPALIAGFTLVSYIIAISIKGGSLTVNRAAVVEGQAGSPIYAGYGQFTVYSPKRSTYDVSLRTAGDTETGLHEVVPGELFHAQSLGGEMVIEQDGGTVLRGLQIGLWDKKSFDMPVAINAHGAFDATAVMVDGARAKVTVTNNSNISLRDCALMNGDSPTPVGDLPPGKSVTATVKWASGSNSSVIRIPGMSQGIDADSDSPESTRGRIRSAVTQALQDSASGQRYGWMNNGTDGSFGKTPNILVGWFDDPLMHITVNKSEPQGVETNVFVLHLPTPEKAGYQIESGTNPFVLEAVLALDDEQQPGAKPNPAKGKP